MLIDANLLLYAVDSSSQFNERASRWLEEILNGDRRVGLPWQTIGSFLRIITHPRVTTNPLSWEQAWRYVDSWLDSGSVWVPPATERTAAVMARITSGIPITGNLVPDAQLAALAVEHGLVLHSADTDFARFPQLQWLNPLSSA
ncbi:MAG: TA system VapC family ribonuclease toxin [Pseudonocardiaceae bacterium]